MRRRKTTLKDILKLQTVKKRLKLPKHIFFPIEYLLQKIIYFTRIYISILNGMFDCMLVTMK